MTNWAQIFTGLLFYCYDGVHQVRRLVFDNYQTCTFPLKTAPRKSTFALNKIVLLFDQISCLLGGYTCTCSCTPDIEHQMFWRYVWMTCRLVLIIISWLINVFVFYWSEGDDWREAITLKESDYHLIPSMGLQLNVFNSVKPDFKALPQ